jgi:glycosyltransferase involved in cell wall biosynthesis
VVCLHLNAFHPKERGWRAADQIATLECEAIFLSAHQAVVGSLPFLRHSAALIGIAHTDDEDSYGEFRAAEPYCAAYVGVSSAITATLQSLRRALPRPAVRQIPYGVPPAAIRAEVAPGPARILTVSRLVQRQKRVLDLPLIWRQYLAKGGNGTLTICGPGEETARLRAAFAEDIRCGRVTLTGAVPLERMPQIYAAHDILLSVSAYEGLPLVVLEAAMAGLYPIVSRTRSGHPEILDCLGEGRLCDIGDLGGFAAALLEISFRLDRVRALRPRLRARAQEHFNLSRMVEAYAQLAAETVRTRSQVRPDLLPAEMNLPRPKVDLLRRLARRWQYSRHYGWLGGAKTTRAMEAQKADRP